MRPEPARSPFTPRALCCLLSFALLWSPAAPRVALARTSSVTGDAAGPIPAASQTVLRWRGGELLVRFRGDVPEQGRDAIAASRGARRKGGLRGGSRLEKLELPEGQDATAVADELRREPGVELAEPNFIVAASQVTPDDARFREQWARRGRRG